MTAAPQIGPTRAESLEPLPDPETMPPPVGQVPPAPRHPPVWSELQGALADLPDEDKSHAVEAWREQSSRYGKETTDWTDADENDLKTFTDTYQDNLRKNVKFTAEDKPYKHLAGGILTDPLRPADAMIQAARDGLIPRQDRETVRQALAAQQAIQDNFRLEQEAGGAQGAKAFTTGAVRGGAFLAGAIPGAKLGAAGGAMIPGIGQSGIGPAAGAVLVGIAGGVLASETAGLVADTIAENNETIRSFLASEKLHPNISAAGELTSFLIPTPVGVAKGIKRFQLVAENLGRQEAVKQAAKYVAVSGGIGAASAPVMAAIDRFKNSALDLGHEQQADLFDPKSIAANTVLAVMLGNLGVKFTKFNAGQAASIHQRGMRGEKLTPAETEMFNTINRKIAQDPNSFFFEAEQATMGGAPLGGAAAVRTRAMPTQPPPAGAAPPRGGAAPPPRAAGAQQAPPPRGGGAQQQPPPRGAGAPPPRRAAGATSFASQEEFNSFMEGARQRGDSEGASKAWSSVNAQGNKRWFTDWYAGGRGDQATQWFANSVVNGRNNAAHAEFIRQQQQGAAAPPPQGATTAGAAATPQRPSAAAGGTGGAQGRPGTVPGVSGVRPPVAAPETPLAKSETALSVAADPKASVAKADAAIDAALAAAVPELPLVIEPIVTPAPARVAPTQPASGESPVMVAAAYRTPDGRIFTGEMGKEMKGVTHMEADMAAEEAGVSVNESMAGFVDRSGKFYTREEAYQVAKGQIDPARDTFEEGKLHTGKMKSFAAPEPAAAPAGGVASPLAGPALRNAGEAPLLGKIGEEHAAMKVEAAKRGEDYIGAEHGFHDEAGNFLSRTEAAQRALDTGLIDQAAFDKIMARKEPGLKSQDLRDIAKRASAEQKGGGAPEATAEAKVRTAEGQPSEDIIDFGTTVFEPQKGFAAWSDKMLDKFGDKAAPVLERVWKSLSGQDIKPEFREGGAIFGGGRRRRGRQPDALPQEERYMTLHGFYEGSADVFRKHPTFKWLGKAIDKQVDLADKRLGDTMGKVEAWEARTSKKDQAEAKDTFSQYIDARESGRTADAANIFTTASSAAQDLIKTVGDIAEYTGRISTTIVQPNGRVGSEVIARTRTGPRGGWVTSIRPLRNLGRNFFPRIIKPEYDAVLRDPLSDPAKWDQMKQDLVNNGNAATLAEAEEFVIGGSKTNEADSDFLGSLYRGRGDRLPANWYDTSIEGFEDWAVRWSDTISKIEAFGQKIRPHDTNAFEEALKLTTHAPTRAFINSVSARAYNERNVGPAAKYLLEVPRLLASGLFLTNPVTIGINALSSKIMNTFTYGLRANFARNPLAVFKKGNHLDAYALGVLKRDMVRLLYRDDLPGLDALKDFTNKAMTVSGYSAIENLTRVDSYLTAQVFLHDGLAAVRKNPESRHAMQFMAFLKRNDFDVGAIIRENGTGDATDTYLRKTIRDTQGGYAYNQVPWWTETPLGRFMLQFSKFSTMLTRNVMRNVFEPAFVGTPVTIKVGGKTITKRVYNVKPLLYFLAGTVAGGELINYLKEKAFGIERKDATLDEIAKTMDKSTRDGLVLLGVRALNDMLTMGMLGIFGTPIQSFKDVTDRSKFRNPLAPPGVSLVKNTTHLIQSGIEQKQITAKDVTDFMKSSVSMYRYGDAFIKEQSKNAGIEWEAAELKARKDDISFMRAAARRYAKEVGLPTGQKTTMNRHAKTETTPMRQELMDALMIGDAPEAKQVVTDYLKEFPSIAEKEIRLRSLRSSVAQNQPVKVGGYAGNERRIGFMDWAKTNLSAGDMERIKTLDETYRKTAEGIGLMSIMGERAEAKLMRETARERQRMKIPASAEDERKFLERSLRKQRRH